MPQQHLFHVRLRPKTADPLYFTAIFENNQRRNAPNVVATAQLAVFLQIDLAHGERAADFLREFLQHGRKLSAGRSVIGIKIDENRLSGVDRGVEIVGVELHGASGGRGGVRVDPHSKSDGSKENEVIGFHAVRA